MHVTSIVNGVDVDRLSATIDHVSAEPALARFQFRAGNHWIVGDVRNTPGRSMHVRLTENARGAAGKWVDEATGEHGDLLDVIAHSCGLLGFRDVVEEARRSHPSAGISRRNADVETSGSNFRRDAEGPQISARGRSACPGLADQFFTYFLMSIWSSEAE